MKYPPGSRLKWYKEKTRRYKEVQKLLKKCDKDMNVRVAIARYYAEKEGLGAEKIIELSTELTRVIKQKHKDRTKHYEIPHFLAGYVDG